MAALPAEAPYRMDAATTALCAKYWNAEAASRAERASELSRRLLAAAEAARWPPHSLALAQLRARLLHSLTLARIGYGDSCLKWQESQQSSPALPTAEEDSLVSLACATLCSRLDAGTLLTLTPSELAFEHAWNLSLVEGCGWSGTTPPTKKHALGYDMALFVTEKLVLRVVQALIFADRMEPGLDGGAEVVLYLTRHVADEVRVILRMLALVRLVRCAPRGARDPDKEMVADGLVSIDEMRLVKFAGDIFQEAESQNWFPRAMERTGYRPLVTQLRAAWQDVLNAFGPLLTAGIVMKTTSAVAASDAEMVGKRQSWKPRECAQCGAREAEPKLFKVCGRCHAVAFCCKEHQAAHWPAHKAACKAASKAAAAAAAS